MSTLDEKARNAHILYGWWMHPLTLLIIGGPVIDVLSFVTHDSAISASAIIRALLLLAMFILFVIAPKSKVKTHSIWMLVLCGLFFVSQALFAQYDTLSELAHQIIRMWYLPLFLVMLFGSVMPHWKKIPKAILIGATGYASVIILTSILGLSLYTHDNAYTQGGASGWFYAGNEIGIALAVGALLSIPYLSAIQRFKKVHYIPLIIFVAIPMIGTKVALLGGVLAIVLPLIYYCIKKKTSNVSPRVLIVSSAIFITSLLFGPLLQHFAVRNASAATVEKNDIVKTVRSKVFGGRIYYLEKRSQEFIEGDLSRTLVGRGDYANESKVRISEMDPFDILFANGFIGATIYFLMIVGPVRIALKRFRQHTKSKALLWTLQIVILLMLVLSALAGHILVAPAVAIVLVGVIYYLKCSRAEGK